MKKELKDYLHLYLGCEIIGTYRDASGSKGYLTGITNGGCDCEIQFILEDGINVEEEPYINDIAQVKPILRPLSDMTEDEENEIEGEYGSYGLGEKHLCNALKNHDLRYVKKLDEAFGLIHYLLSKSFDIFGLIEAGLAIDASTLKQKS